MTNFIRLRSDLGETQQGTEEIGKHEVSRYAGELLSMVFDDCCEWLQAYTDAER